MLVLVIAMNALVFAAAFLLVATMFRAPVETKDASAFRVDVDNVDRNTVFEMVPLRPLLVPLYHLVRRLNAPRFKAHVERLLLALGNPNQYTPDEYLVMCMVWGVVGAIALWLGALTVLGGLSLLAAVLYLLLGFFVGFFGAYLWLRERALSRLRLIAKRLPYTLDLVAMAMDAGATFYEAAHSVVQDEPEDPLNEELSVVVREIDFGRSRQDALTHLGERISVEGLDGILSAVLQAEQLGTPLADVLKLQANLLRMRRSMRAERRAGEAAVKMLIPSMLILMAVVIVIFAPLIVRFIEGTYLE
ncbi:MAG: type II secretion system F family protein [Planctomycetes bacterium]|nr:type II secretion system F family protein [Planctomycetota bacterium]